MPTKEDTTMAAPAAHMTSPNEPFPSAAHLAQATTTHRQGRFAVSSRKLPISKAGPIDAMERALGIPVPEMIFGDNVVTVRHEPTGWAIAFNAYDALDAVDKTDRHMLQVAYAREWSASRENSSAGIRDVVRPFDWSYSTTYRGTVENPLAAAAAAATATTNEKTEQGANDNENEKEKKEEKKGEFAPTDDPIPLALLKRRDPILFFDEVMLYESELDDNGISALSAKLRVHEQRMLLLCRLYMRLDGVVVRVRDTRIYVDFAADRVVREYTAREAGFDDTRTALLMSGLRPDDITVALRDANRVADLLPIVEQSLEAVSLKS